MQKQKRILYLGDYVARTGFATVSHNIVAELKRHFGANLQLDIVAINYFGEPYYENENVFVCPAKSNDVNADDFGRFFFLKMLQESNDYDGLFICQDLGTIVSFLEVMQHIKDDKKKQSKKSFKSIFYFPVDSKIIKELTRGLEFFDVLVTYTEYGRKEILSHRPELKPKLKVIPHGNNSKHFYPLPASERLEFRKKYFGENADKFIITNVNRNQPRKDIPSTIFGFIEAKKVWTDDLPMPFLYLHLHPKDSMGWDIRAILMQTDLKEDVDYKLLPKEFEQEMCDIPTLNKIYNASDCYISTTLGEGYGLTYADAAATKTPVVAPYNTSFMEMSGFGKNAYMLMTSYPYCHVNDNVIREQSDIYEIGETLHKVASDKHFPEDDTLLNKVENNYKWVSKLEWSEVCKQWIEYFKIF